jgi:hypothetical protein
VALVKGDPLVEPEVWEAALCDIDGVGPLVVGVEDHHGHGAAVAFCCQLPDGRFIVGGELHQSRADAYAVAGRAATSRPGSILVVGASLASDAELATIPVLALKKAGLAETGASLANLRDLLGTGRVVHDGSPDLASQLFQARVTEGRAGMSLIPRSRSDLLRAAVWALRVASTQPASVPVIR